MIGSATISIAININQTSTSGTAGLVTEHVLNGNQPLITLSNGTGSGQVDKLWSDTGTLVSTTIEYDLTALMGAIVGTVDLARDKLLFIQNLATTDGFDLVVGGAGTDPYTGYMSGTETIPAGGFVLRVAPLATAFPTSGTSKVLKLNSGSHTIKYKIVLLGSSS